MTHVTKGGKKLNPELEGIKRKNKDWSIHIVNRRNCYRTNTIYTVTRKKIGTNLTKYVQKVNEKTTNF